MVLSIEVIKERIAELEAQKNNIEGAIGEAKMILVYLQTPDPEKNPGAAEDNKPVEAFEVK
jgi:hypothetical protein